MNKICTDIEQSKKLIELGIDINTADLTVVDLPIQNGDRFKFISSKLPNDTFSSITDGKSEKIPVWSLSALLNLLPSEFTEVGKYSTTTYKIDIRKYKFTDDVDLYQIAYGSIKFDVDGQHSFKDMVNTDQKEEPIDAVFQMIVWLKENGKI
jgi:hypothetical protein